MLEHLKSDINAVSDSLRAATVWRDTRNEHVRACLRAGWSQRALAEELGLGLSTIQFWLTEARRKEQKT